MPSPLGHALAGATVGWATMAAFGRREWADVWRLGLMFAIFGMLPDIDLLFGAHRGATHGFGAAALIGMAALAATRSGRFALAAGVAYASHAALDWLGSDSSPPIGIMALWPLSREYFVSEFHVFHAISRRVGTSGFWRQNIRAIVWELLILTPPAVLMWMLIVRRRRSREEGAGTHQYR